VTRGAHIAVRVPEDALQESYDQLMEEGVDDYRDPESCGNRYAFVKDPDGHGSRSSSATTARRGVSTTMIRVEDADEALGYWTCKFEYAEARGRWEADSFANYFMAPRTPRRRR